MVCCTSIGAFGSSYVVEGEPYDGGDQQRGAPHERPAPLFHRLVQRLVIELRPLSPSALMLDEGRDFVGRRKEH